MIGNKAKKKVEKEEQVKEQLVKDEEVKKIKRTKKVAKKAGNISCFPPYFMNCYGVVPAEWIKK